MAFDKTHWKNPRGTIACRFVDNDIAYATHGGIMVLETLTAFDQHPRELANLRILDYGCGTGRAARLLSKICGHVYAYDPVQECIDLVMTECTGIAFDNVTATTYINSVPVCDIAISQNVIEHLTDADAKVMIANLQEKVAGMSYIWYSTRRNTNVLKPWLTAEQMAEDAAHERDRIVLRPFNLRN